MKARENENKRIKIYSRKTPNGYKCILKGVELNIHDI